MTPNITTEAITMDQNIIESDKTYVEASDGNSSQLVIDIDKDDSQSLEECDAVQD